MDARPTAYKHPLGAKVTPGQGHLLLVLLLILQMFFPRRGEGM